MMSSDSGAASIMPRTGDARVCVFDEQALPAAAGMWIAEAIIEVVADRGDCAIALAGGSTPRRVYEVLASPAQRGRVPWNRVDVYFGDERAVPPDDFDSNYRMAWESLLRHVPIPAAQVHRIEAERPDREQAAAAYATALPKHLDILLLGMGSDGHTASLYPESPALRERERKVVAALGPKPTRPRITITPVVIAAARRVAVIVAGDAKAATVDRVLNGVDSIHTIPARLARGATWLLDAAAASRLSPRWCGSGVVLAGELGGRRARLALVETGGASPALIAERRYATRNFTGLGDIVREFARDVGPLPASACFAVDCLVPGTECDVPYLPRTVRVRELADDIGIPATIAVTRFSAFGHALPHLREADFAIVHQGVSDSAGRIAFVDTIGGDVGLLSRTPSGNAVERLDRINFIPSPRTDQTEGLVRYLQALSAAVRDVVTRARPTGGVFLTGAKGSRALSRQRADGLRTLFQDHGRAAGELADITIRLVQNGDAVLFGAAAVAAASARGPQVISDAIEVIREHSPAAFPQSASG